MVAREDEAEIVNVNFIEVVVQKIAGDYNSAYYQQDTQLLYLASASSGISIFATNETPFKESTVTISTSSSVVSFLPYASNPVYILGL